MADNPARMPLEAPTGLPERPTGPLPGDSTPDFTPLPSTSSHVALAAFANRSSLTPIVCDERAIARLLGALVDRSGMSNRQLAKKLGVTTNALRQYLHGRRGRPSLVWFLRLAEMCGARVSIEFPAK